MQTALERSINDFGIPDENWDAMFDEKVTWELLINIQKSKWVSKELFSQSLSDKPICKPI